MMTSKEIDGLDQIEFRLTEMWSDGFSPIEEQVKEFLARSKASFAIEVGACVQAALATARPDLELISLFDSSSDSDSLAVFCGLPEELAVDAARYHNDSSYRDGVLAAWRHTRAEIERTINDVQKEMNTLGASQ